VDVGTARAIERAVLDYFKGWFAIEIEITHVDGGKAGAAVRSALHTEYVPLAHTGAGWRIVNALRRRT
jgi:hypothetical protein